MISKRIIATLAGGLIALAVAGAVVVGSPSNASADKCPGCPTPPPTATSGPGGSSPVLAPKPDLVVSIEKASCYNVTPSLPGGNLEMKVRAQNIGVGAATASFVTIVTVDSKVVGQFVSTPPFFGGQVFHVNVPVSGTKHTVAAYVDGTGTIDESHENNNTDSIFSFCD